MHYLYKCVRYSDVYLNYACIFAQRFYQLTKSAGQLCFYYSWLLIIKPWDTVLYLVIECFSIILY